MTKDEIFRLSNELDADAEILDDRPTVRDRVRLANGLLVALLGTDVFDAGVTVPAPYADAKPPPDPAPAAEAAPEPPGTSDDDFSRSSQQGS